MNKIFRVIWNARTACWTAVSEFGKTAGGGGASSVATATAAVALTLSVPLYSFASAPPTPTALPTGGNTTSYVAPNGVTVVNIATANGAGLSHNYFTQYNVQSNGMVLNNGDSSQMSRVSQLAGQVSANLNLVNPASVILNEVVSNNRTTLAGYTEVLGTKADVIVANQYGITCSGCGFINSPRVTLTTGVAQLNSDGSMGLLKVGTGDILITGSGLNATNQQVLDLVARSVVLDGQINAQDVGIVAGANQWNYATRAVSGPADATGLAPTRAIDSTLLGGIYANRIRLIATEAGVGVRMLGDAAASAAEFSLTSAGKVILQNHVSAQTDLNLAVTSGDAQALQLNGTSLSASQDINVSVSGNAALLGGAMVASRDVAINVGALADTAAAGNLADNNRRYAGRNMHLSSAGAATLDGTSWSSVQALDGQFGALALGANSTHVYAGTSESLSTNAGDMALGNALLKSTNDLSLSAVGQLSTTGGAGQGIESTNGNVSLAATSGLVNAGQISADAGGVRVRANGTVSNSGTVHAAGTLDIADRNGGATQNLSNTGTLLADGSMRIGGAALANAAGAVIQANTGSTVQGASLNNQGTWLLSTHGALDTVGVSGALTNQGVLQSDRDLALTANTVANQGTLLAGGNLTANLGTALNNTATVQAGQALTVTGNAALTNGVDGKVLGNTMAIGAGSLDNAGVLQATSGSVTTSGQLHNAASGVMALATADGAGAAVSAASLTNAGQLQSKGTLAVNVGAGGLNDSGTMLSVGDLSVTAQNAAPGNVVIDGVLESIGGAATIRNAATVTVNNHGQLVGDTVAVGAHAMTVNAGALVSANHGMRLAMDGLNNSGTVQAGGNLAATVSVGGLNDSGTMLAVGDIDLSGAAPYALTVGGMLQSNGHATINNANLHVSGSGQLLANQLSVNGPALSVDGGALVSSATGIDMALGTLANSGTVQASANLNANVASTLDNNGAGTLHAGQALAIGGSAAITNAAGAAILGDTLAVTGASLDNAGTVRADTAGAITTTGRLNNAASGLLSLTSLNTGTATVTAGTLVNAGQLQSSGTLAANIGAGGLNDSGVMVSAGNLTVAAQNAPYDVVIDGVLDSIGGTAAIRNAATVSVNNHGQLVGTQVTLGAQAATVNAGAVLSAADAMNLSVDTLTNSGILQAQNDLAIRASAALSNNAVLFAGKTLAVSGNAALSNGANAAMVGDTLAINVASVDNAGLVQATRSSNVSTASTLKNEASGVMSLATASGGSATVAVARLDDAGILQVNGNLTATIGSGGLSVGGTLLAAGDLTVSGANPYAAAIGGTLQGGGHVTVGNATIGVANGAKLLGNVLSVSGAALNVDGSGLVNADRDMDLHLGALTNSGTVEASGNLVATMGVGGATNGGMLLAGGDLTLSGSQPYTLGVGGTVQGGGLVTVSNANVHLNGSGTLLGNKLTVSGQTLQIDDGAKVESFDDMNLTLNRLTMGGSSSVILAAVNGNGNATIRVDNAFSNPGAIHSETGLALTAPALTNTSTGGISTKGDLTLNATNGDISNAGALYAGGNLGASASGTITNLGSGSGPQGTIDAQHGIALTAGTIVNSSTITAGGDVTLSASKIHNDIYGGDTRTLQSATTPVTVQTNHIDCTDCDGANRTETWYYTSTYSQSLAYTGATATATKPSIIGGGTVTLKGFDTGTNVGGIVSGYQVQLTGNGGGANFTNNPMTLTRTDYTETYEHYIDYIAQGPAKYTDDSHHNDSLTHTTVALPSIGAGIFAHDALNASGFALANGMQNDGAQFNKAATPKGGPAGAQSASLMPASGASQTSTANHGLSSTAAGNLVGGGSTTFAGTSTSTLGTAGGGQLQSGVAAVASSTAITYGGLNLALPANPNGYYVTSKAPNASYLVVTNPLFGVTSNPTGSSYLATQLGYNPDQIGLRLGDSNYEAYLVQQQLIAQTGHNLIDGYSNLAAQMQGMLNQAVTESKSLGLVFGQPPSSDQLAKLGHDIVWMVSTVVDGKTVLAPQVYLAASTAASLNAGSAVISGGEVNMNLTSMTNTGGVIAGTNNLNITSTGDITNRSGTITGGNVALKSTAGSIVNQTAVSGSGNALQYVTDVGKTAGIVATGNLSLNAGQDVKNIGAQMAAGGNASLVAGNNVTFDTIARKTTVSSSSAESGFMKSTVSSTSTTTVDQIKSGLTAGGDLNISAGKDITLAGTDTVAGGNAKLDAGGDINLLARANSRTTHSESSTSGLGVGGGLAGNSTTTTDSVSNRNVASTLSIGGNASMTAGKDITLLGSTTDIKGNGDINATNVNVLAGLDSNETHTTTKTTTFLKVDSGSGSASADASAGKSASSSGGQGAKASAQANAEASAAAQGSGGLVLASTSTTRTDTLNTTHVGSSLNVGGDLNINAKNDVNVVGSSVAAGGNANVNATNVNALAAEDVSTSHTSTSTTSIGLMGSSDNQANAHANAGASADSGAYASGHAGANGVSGAAGLDPTKASAQAGAEAGASASSENRLALMKTSTSTTDTLDVTHQGASISAGGNLGINASKSLTTTGSSLGAGQDLNLQAKDMSFNAAQDVHQISTTSSTTSVGLYADASADASAKANAGVGGANMTASADASAEANAKVGVGVYASNTTTSSTHGSTTAQVSSLSAGGNMTRNAGGTITDVGTSISAGGDLNQSATTIVSQAARNTTYDSDSSVTNTAKIGVYAEASAKAEANASGSAGIGGHTADADAKAEASAGAGINATYENSQAKSTSASSDAVVSTVNVGGKFNSTSTGKTVLEGTNITSGGDASLKAASLDYTAAQNTASSSDKSVDGKGEVKVDLVQKSVGLAASFDNSNATSTSTTAVVGSINSGGKLDITTTGDANFTGTTLASTDKTTLNSGGNVTFAAAANTSSDTSNGLSVAADVTVGKGEGGGKSGGFNASAGYTNESSQSSDAVAASITSGGGLSINSGGNATFVGTTIAAQGDTSIAAKGDLAFQAAHSTASSQSFGVDASIGASKESSAKEGTTKSGEIGLGGEYAKSNSNTATAGSITSGGNLNLSSGANTTLEGTTVAVGGQASIAAGGNVNVTAAVSTSSSTGFSASLEASHESTTKPAAGGAAKPAAGGAAKPAAGAGAAMAAAKGGQGAKAGAAEAKPEAEEGPETKGKTGFSLAGQNETTAAAGTISAGNGFNITAGGNAGFSGTKIDGGTGDVAVNAGGNVAFGTADGSAHGGSIGATNTVINNASLSGATTKQAAEIQAGGNVTVNAGGSASFAGTQATSAGSIAVNAAKGVTTQNATSASGQIGLTQAGASVDTQTVSLKGGAGTLIQAGPARNFSASVAIPAALPPGTSVAAQTADGKPLPNWLSFNAATGKFSGTPPADFSGSLGVQVSIPQSDGTPKIVSMNFSATP
ncbi:hemagglutinin repeat-containing protein [Massilia sp. 9096]|uniref:hemagglutinin repeat-containing protein n=1 Tax=Massilia sp. 9096 TaxID=1500894 RepID=UPI00055AEEFB|nr:hemagglutinin repeat-containing protein [Massilia sp. 9096]